ncbi:hypothetical protein LG634_02795 [Streptomyces bambusae]|uniref:hypothetical protein n=1 Tax=Streptomyces bambusae TaxID=1550616 RepID=UPI001CFEF173|nr:hypothetical protein [Streptomyces bambusae]MCB5163772.1 hypothetical protein [Streptomyces bambusae]
MTALLRLYPAAYRREFGDEIALAYHEATQDAGRPARLREAADVAGHALRMRLGLSSAGRTGQRLAALAPFALVAVGLQAMGWSGLLLRTAQVTGGPAALGPLLLLVAAAHLATLLGAALALAGRWPAGTWTALLGLLTATASDATRLGGAGALAHIGLFGTLPLLLALSALLCPPDLRPLPRFRTTAGLVAVVAWTAVLATALVLVPLPALLVPLRFAVPAVALLALAGRPAFARLTTAPAVLLAGLPVILSAVPTGPVLAAPLLLALAVTAAAVPVRRRRARRASRGRA